MSEVKPPRAVLSDVTATFLGIISLQVDVVPLKRPDARPEIKTACPTCVGAVPLKQRLVCPDDDTHGPFTAADVDRCLETTKDTFVRVTDAEIEALKETTVPTGEATFTVYPAAQVEAATLPAGTAYRLRPRKPTAASKTSYAMIVDLLADPDHAWICEMTNRGVQNMYRAWARDGVITLSQLIRPGEFHTVEPVDAIYEQRMLHLARELVAEALTEFEPDAYLNSMRDRADALRAAKIDPTAPVVTPAPVKVTVVDDTNALMALLEASVAHVKVST